MRRPKLRVGAAMVCAGSIVIVLPYLHLVLSRTSTFPSPLPGSSENVLFRASPAHQSTRAHV